MYQNSLMWRKSECQLRRIRGGIRVKKSKGQVDIVVGMFFLVILSVLVIFGFRMVQYMVTAAYVEDALAASNLASAIIDLEEYGKSHIIKIPDPENAYALYREAVCHNLHLDEELNTTNTEVLADKVTILEYSIYNVREEDIEIYILDGNGRLQDQRTGIIGETYTADGTKVETTSVYSRVGFYVNGLLGQKIYAEKEKSVDIVRCESE